MGDFFQKLGDLQAGAVEAKDLAARVVNWLVAEEIVSGDLNDCVLGGLGRGPGRCHSRALQNAGDAGGLWATEGGRTTNGVQLEVGRQVYHNGQSGVSDAACPHCGSIERFADFSGAFDDWFAAGVADHACSICGRRSLINDWILKPQWGVGHIQLTFWNWPLLSEQFRQDVSTQLNSHRLLYIGDKF